MHDAARRVRPAGQHRQRHRPDPTVELYRVGRGRRRGEGGSGVWVDVPAPYDGGGREVWEECGQRDLAGPGDDVAVRGVPGASSRSFARPCADNLRCQFFLRTTDEEVEKYLKIFTFIRAVEIEGIMQDHKVRQAVVLVPNFFTNRFSHRRTRRTVSRRRSSPPKPPS